MVNGGDSLQMRGSYRGAHTFLRLLLGAARDEDGLLPSYLVLRDRRSGQSFWTRSLEVAAAITAQTAGRGHDADFHVALHDLDARRAEEGSEVVIGSYMGAFISRLRGLSVTASLVFGLWLDLDYGALGHQSRNLPPDREAAIQIIKRLERDVGRQFSLIVDSGGGLHVYVLFREPWTLDTDEERARARQLCNAFQRRAGIIAGDLGRERTGTPWELDTTSDLARVLRVAGTRNFKSAPAREVRIVEQSAVRWNPSDFGELPAIATLLDDPQITARPTRRAHTRAPQSRELQGVRRKLAKDMRSSPPLAGTWRHKRDEDIARTQYRQARPIDTSMSVYDFHLAGIAARLGWTEQETRCLLHLHQEHEGRLPAAKPDQYYQRTIERAGRLLRADENPASPPPPAPTRPIVRTVEDLAVIQKIASAWTPGQKSVSVCGWPGLGKTTAFGHAAVAGLASLGLGWEGGVAVLALPTRSLVDEKATALRQYGAERNVRVLVSLGRSPEPESGWYCERATDHRLRSELHRPGCKECPSWTSCSSATGHYLLESGKVVDALESAHEESPVLLITTRDLLTWSWRRIPTDAPIILDDVGPRFGLVRDIALRHVDICSAREKVGSWLQATLRGRDTTLQALRDGDSAGTSPMGIDLALAADLVERIFAALQSLHSSEPDGSSLSGRIAELPAEYRDALLTDGVQPALFWDGKVLAWPWEEACAEDGVDQRPAFTDFALDVARAVLRGRPPVVHRTSRSARSRGEPEFHVLMPDDELIARARAGRVVWLGVGPMPSQVAASLDARQEVIVAQPERLRVITCLTPTELDFGRERYLTFGPTRRGGKPVGDEITRALYRALEAKVAEGPIRLGTSDKRRLGAILHKADWEDLGRPKSVGYYGRDNAGTNCFADCDLLVVRRHVPPFEVVRLDAAAIRAALGIGMITPVPCLAAVPEGGRELPVGTIVERRQWEGSDVDFVTLGFLDPLERDLQRYYELHHQLNAVGRCRPLTSENESVVLLLASIPFDWVRPELRSLKGLLAEVGVEVALPDPEARRDALKARQKLQGHQAVERRLELARLLREEGRISQRGLATRLGVSRATIVRDLAELGTEVATLFHPSLLSLLEQRMKQSGHLRWPTLDEVVDEIRSGEAPLLAKRTIRRRLGEIRRAVGAGAPLVPSRSDAAQSLQLTLEAVVRLVGRPDECEEGQRA